MNIINILILCVYNNIDYKKLMHIYLQMQLVEFETKIKRSIL